MTRREFTLVLLASVARLGPLGFPSVADAQQPASPRRIGVLLAASLPEEEMAQAFRQGLLGAGYSEGRDVVIEWRSATATTRGYPSYPPTWSSAELM